MLTAFKPLMPVNRLVAAALLPHSIRLMVDLPASSSVDLGVRAGLRVLQSVSKPLLARLALRLAGPDATRFYAEIPERTSQRGFGLRPLAARG